MAKKVEGTDDDDNNDDEKATEFSYLSRFISICIRNHASVCEFLCFLSASKNE